MHSSGMRVLGVDPGYDRLGVAILEEHNGQMTVRHSDCITSDATQPIPERLAELGAQLKEIFTMHQPTHVAVESLFFNKNQKTAIAVAEARGMILYLARTSGCHVCEYTPQQVKIAVTGYGKSDKQQVTAMVQTLIPAMRKDALDDEYDAAAVGITCLASERGLST